MKDRHGTDIKLGDKLDIQVQNGVVHGVVVSHKGTLGLDLGDTIWELNKPELDKATVIE